MREGESQKKPETEIKGFSVSKGIAHGEAFVLLHKEQHGGNGEIQG